MQWQMSGGETKGDAPGESKMQPEAKETSAGFEDGAVALSEESDGGEDGSASMEKRTDEAGPRTVLDKS